MPIEEHALDAEACAEDDGCGVDKATDSRSVSPLQAARRHCLWCCNGSTNEVRLCAATGYPMHPFRFGRRPTTEEVAAVACRNVHPFEDEITQGEFHIQGATALRAIRRRCLDCPRYSVKEIREGKFANCSLWPFRG
jgi:hypothetical protein